MSGEVRPRRVVVNIILLLGRIGKLWYESFAQKAENLKQYRAISASGSKLFRVSFLPWQNPWWMIRNLCSGLATACRNFIRIVRSITYYPWHRKASKIAGFDHAMLGNRLDSSWIDFVCLSNCCTFQCLTTQSTCWLWKIISYWKVPVLSSHDVFNQRFPRWATWRSVRDFER